MNPAHVLEKPPMEKVGPGEQGRAWEGGGRPRAGFQGDGGGARPFILQDPQAPPVSDGPPRPIVPSP